MSRFATRPLLGGKRTSLMRWLISANDPKRTLLSAGGSKRRPMQVALVNVAF